MIAIGPIKGERTGGKAIGRAGSCQEECRRFPAPPHKCAFAHRKPAVPRVGETEKYPLLRRKKYCIPQWLWYITGPWAERLRLSSRFRDGTSHHEEGQRNGGTKKSNQEESSSENSGQNNNKEEDGRQSKNGFTQEDADL
ncbi:MAG: hypothetical protein R3231_07580 [bacterium]|nr:hypothetical protein [bacterium]